MIMIHVLGNPKIDKGMLDGWGMSNHIIWKPVEGFKFGKTMELQVSILLMLNPFECELA